MGFPLMRLEEQMIGQVIEEGFHLIIETHKYKVRFKIQWIHDGVCLLLHIHLLKEGKTKQYKVERESIYDTIGVHIFDSKQQ